MTQRDNLVIKTARPENAEEIARLEGEIFSDGWSVKSITEAIENRQYLILCAECDGKIVGYINISVVAGEANINRIAVSTDYRRHGIAQGLISEAEKQLGERAEVFLLEVRESNSAAIKLYEKHGFKTDGIRKNFYSAPTENAVLMSREMTK